MYDPLWENHPKVKKIRAESEAKGEARGEAKGIIEGEVKAFKNGHSQHGAHTLSRAT